MIKKIFRPVVKIIIAILPLSISLALLRKIPRLINVFPDNKKIVFKHYLEDITVNVNTVYPIEKEMLKGRYDEPTLFIIDKFVNQGDTVLDIGANIGAITLALAKKAGPDSLVIAFEPGGFTFKRLSKNINLNPELKKSVKLVKMGVSNKKGMLYWREDKNIKGNAEILGIKPEEGEPVKITTIDRYWQKNRINKLNFVKIDVEGMEYEVIKGGLCTWQKYLPILYYETIDHFEVDRGFKAFKKIENLLKELGYEFYKITDDHQIIKTEYPDLSLNTLAVHKEKLKSFNLK